MEEKFLKSFPSKQFLKCEDTTQDIFPNVCVQIFKILNFKCFGGFS